MGLSVRGLISQVREPVSARFDSDPTPTAFHTGLSGGSSLQSPLAGGGIELVTLGKAPNAHYQAPEPAGPISMF